MAIDTIGTNAIANDAVNAAKIAAGAVDADITAIPDGSVSTAKLADNAVTGAKLYAENLGRRNVIINGAMQVWQRATSVTTSGSGTFSADRWASNAGASTVFSRSTDVPTGFQYSMSVAGSAYTGIRTRLEAVDCKKLAGQEVTFSWYAKRTSGTGDMKTYLGYASAENNFGTVTLIEEVVNTASASVSSDWARYTYTVTLPSGAANGIHFVVFNGTGSGSVTTLYTGIQLELGDTATPFEHHGYGEELSLCQRYFQIGGHCTGRTYSGTQAELYYHFLTEMRTSPSISMRGAGNANNYDTGQGHISGVSGYDITAVAASQPNPTGTVLRPTTSGSWGAGNIVGLRGNIANIDAEL